MNYRKMLMTNHDLANCLHVLADAWTMILAAVTLFCLMTCQTIAQESSESRQDGVAIEFERQPYRTWTDKSGKFQVEARVEELTDDQVRLSKKDNRIVWLAIEKLSPLDQDYLKKLRDQSTSAANPFAGGVEIDAVNRDQHLVLAPGELPIAGDVMAPRHEVTLDPVPWSYVPTAAPTNSPAPTLKLPELPNLRLYGPEMKAKMFPSGNQGDISAIYRMNELHDRSQIVVVDAKSGQIAGNFELPIKYIRGVAVSPSNDTIATILAPSFPHAGGIVFWKQKHGALVADRAWRFVASNLPNSIMSDVLFYVDDRHLLTVGSHLALWDTDTDTCIYSVSNPGCWALTRDFSHVVFRQKGSLWVMRVSTGEIVGRIVVNPEVITSIGYLDVSPDGRSLVASAGQFLYGFDLKDGSATFSFDAGEAISSVFWTDDSLLFVNRHRVFEPNLGVVVWEISMGFGLQWIQAGTTSWILSDTQLSQVELIDAARRKEIAQITAGLDAQDVQRVGPGTRIALSTKLEALKQGAEEATKILRQKLEERGFVIDDSASVRLEAIIEPGATSRFEFWDDHHSVLGPIKENVPYVPHTCYLRLILDGEPIWQVSQRYAAESPLILLRRNEPIEDAVRRVSSPNPDFFSGATLPHKILGLPRGRHAGSSRIEEDGLH